MAVFSISTPGTNEDANEVRRRITEIGIAIGYGARRGPRRGYGGMSLMIRDLANGKAIVLPASNSGDLAWLAGVFEALIPENPLRVEMLRSGIAACAAAIQLEEAGPVSERDISGRYDLSEG